MGTLNLRGWEKADQRLCDDFVAGMLGRSQLLRHEIMALRLRLTTAEQLCDDWENYEAMLNDPTHDEEEQWGAFARCSVSWKEWAAKKGGG